LGPRPQASLRVQKEKIKEQREKRKKRAEKMGVLYKV
jgi:hypothetical protein